MLAVRRLRAGYGTDVPVLFDVDLELQPGRVLAVLGRNGAGKSTLLRAIMGVVPVGAGEIELCGRPITGWRPEEVARAGIGYVPQGGGVFAGLTVDDNLLLGAVGRNRDAGREPSEILGRFPVLAERRDRLAESLSGGEQRQLALARALAGRPDYLLLDEPSEGLQPSLVQMLEQTLRAIVRERGLAILMVEQNVDLIHALADEIAILEEGHLVTLMTAAELARDPARAERHLGL